jgi:hypothetical protein
MANYKVCNLRDCNRKIPKDIKNNPKGEPLCAYHHAFQVRLNDDSVKCTIIGCINAAFSSGLCKAHQHPSHEERMDLRTQYTEDRTKKLMSILGGVLKSTKPLDTLTKDDFNCIYCGDASASSMGPSPPHACPICWVAITKC